LSQNFISIKAKYKFWLCSNSVVLDDFGTKVTINLNGLKGAIFSCQLMEMLISDFALGIPGCSEVYDSVAGFSSKEVGIEFLKFLEILEVREQEASCKPEHINIKQ